MNPRNETIIRPDAPLAPGEVELLFLGTGTSAGVPMIACECETCTSTDPRDNRTRCSVVFSYKVDPASLAPEAGTGRPRDVCRVLVDTTPELRVQAVAQKLMQIDALVFTHAHADHVMGLDDVRRFNAQKNGPLDVWADARTHETLQGCFGYTFRQPDPASRLFRPHLVPRTIDGPFEVEGQAWTPVTLLHGALPTLGFRVGDLAYCTDVNEIPGGSWPLLEGLDVLVLDGLQWTKHATHFTVEEAVEVSRRLRPRMTYLTHIAHGVLHRRDEPKLPENVRLAYDGLRVRAGRG